MLPIKVSQFFERDIFVDVYTKLVIAQELFLEKATKNKIPIGEFLEIYKLFFKAYTHAKLLLPNEIVNHTKLWPDKVMEYIDSQIIEQLRSLTKTERKEKQELKREISLQDHTQIFSPYLRLRVKKKE